VRVIFVRKSNRNFFIPAGFAIRSAQKSLSRPITRQSKSAPDMLPESYQAGQPSISQLLAALCLQSSGSSRFAPEM
jgi:hypothetical protein